jgi:hypothetical protein
MKNNTNKANLRNTRSNNFQSDTKDKLDINKKAVKTIAPLSLVGLFGVNASADETDQTNLETKSDQSLLSNLDKVELNTNIEKPEIKDIQSVDLTDTTSTVDQTSASENSLIDSPEVQEDVTDSSSDTQVQPSVEATLDTTSDSQSDNLADLSTTLDPQLADYLSIDDNNQLVLDEDNAFDNLDIELVKQSIDDIKVINEQAALDSSNTDNSNINSSDSTSSTNLDFIESSNLDSSVSADSDTLTSDQSIDSTTNDAIAAQAKQLAGLFKTDASSSSSTILDLPTPLILTNLSDSITSLDQSTSLNTSSLLDLSDLPTDSTPSLTVKTKSLLKTAVLATNVATTTSTNSSTAIPKFATYTPFVVSINGFTRFDNINLTNPSSITNAYSVKAKIADGSIAELNNDGITGLKQGTTYIQMDLYDNATSIIIDSIQVPITVTNYTYTAMPGNMLVGETIAPRAAGLSFQVTKIADFRYNLDGSLTAIRPTTNSPVYINGTNISALTLVNVYTDLNAKLWSQVGTPAKDGLTIYADNKDKYQLVDYLGNEFYTIVNPTNYQFYSSIPNSTTGILRANTTIDTNKLKGYVVYADREQIINLSDGTQATYVHVNQYDYLTNLVTTAWINKAALSNSADSAQLPGFREDQDDIKYKKNSFPILKHAVNSMNDETQVVINVSGVSDPKILDYVNKAVEFVNDAFKGQMVRTTTDASEGTIDLKASLAPTGKWIAGTNNLDHTLTINEYFVAGSSDDSSSPYYSEETITHMIAHEILHAFGLNHTGIDPGNYDGDIDTGKWSWSTPEDIMWGTSDGDVDTENGLKAIITPQDIDAVYTLIYLGEHYGKKQV